MAPVADTPLRLPLPVFLFLGLLACFISACTVRYAPVEPGLIPNASVPTPKDVQFGHDLFADLKDDYESCTTHPRYEQLNRAFEHVIRASRADHVPWHIHLFSDREIINVRAVRGNRMFVWSGFLDAVESEDEIAAVLANEIGHVLTRHTDPVQFHPLSDVLFQAASLAATVGILYLSHGAVAITGNWSKWAYMKAANLTPLDREYNGEEEREAAELALLILQRSRYMPEALVTFWRRMEEDEVSRRMAEGLQRDFSAEQRVSLLEGMLPELADWADQDPAKEERLANTGAQAENVLDHPFLP